MDHRVDVNGVSFRFGVNFCVRSTEREFFICKPPGLVDAYRRLVENVQPKRIVELGIYEGGSAAFLALLARPTKLVAVDLESERVAPLDALAKDRSLPIRAFYGVDQADRARLAEIVDTEFGTDGIDLVIDDASHALDPTRASFEVLFPRLAPGGLYVIEDWSAKHRYLEAVARVAGDGGPHPALDGMAHEMEGPPLSLMMIELVLARALPGDAITDVTIDGDWIIVRRGPGALDLSSFRLADLYVDRLELLPHPAPAPPSAG